MPEISESIAQFRALHAYARSAALTVTERQLYESGKRELSQIFMAAQRLALRPGEVARSTLRVPLVLPVRLESPSSQESASTTDLSNVGFAARIKRVIPVGTLVEFSMVLPRSKPVMGRATVVCAGRPDGDAGIRTSFTFEKLSESSRHRLEIVIFDDILSVLATEQARQ
jgi:hypothetical protein